MSKALFFCSLILCLGQIPTRADSAGRDMVREAAIEKEFAQRHPELLETLRAARVAYDKRDFAGAERLLREITQKAPDSDVGYRRLGASLLEQGRRFEGMTDCEKALTMNRSVDNLETVALYLASNQNPPPSPADLERALGLLKECQGKPNGNSYQVLAAKAQLAIQLKDANEFQAAATALEAYPTNMASHYFGAINAAMNARWMRAEDEIYRAGKLGLPKEEVEKFLDNGVRSQARWPRLMLRTGWVIGLWLAGLVLLFLLGVLLSRLTLRQVEGADPQATISAGEKKIRRFYRAVINVAGVYYYVSLPVVIVLVIGLVAIVFYLFLMLGHIPIKLMLILALGALVTIIAMIKSLFIRVNAPDPGRALHRSEAEGLWNLTQEVAAAVGTRPIDEIRITPGTELAVYERGTWQQKLRNEAQRVLILGVGVLHGFKQDAFRCVLAHEYGHFSNRDTAGGDIALRVQNDMLKFYLAMRAARQATYTNAAFHFLRLYHLIFRRISHGATRLQEILADRVAAQAFGAPAFESGLTHVIRRSIEFEAAANQEIKQSLAAHRPLRNMYELEPPADGTVATAFQQSLNRPTTPDDTHPSPKDRFRLVARVGVPRCNPLEGEVWELFRDPEAIRAEMSALIEKQVAPHRGASAAATPSSASSPAA